MDIASKIAAESLLSLYPVFVKNIGLPVSIQLWSRCFTYVVISLFFLKYSTLWKNVFSKIYNVICYLFYNVKCFFFIEQK